MYLFSISPWISLRLRKVKWKSLSCVRLHATPWTDYTVHGILQARILNWVAFPFSRGIIPTQGPNRGLPHCRQILYQLSHQGSPRILERVAFPFSRGLPNPGILPTQGPSRGLPHCRQILYQLRHQGISRILEWIAFPSSRGSSQPRDRTQVSHIAGGFSTSQATKESLRWRRILLNLWHLKSLSYI